MNTVFSNKIVKNSALGLITMMGVGISSCEKVITLDLNEADREYVIDAAVSNSADYNYVKISRSDDFYESEDFESVSGATVTLTDEMGNATIFTEVTDGYYSNSSFTGAPYTTYNLEVQVGGEIITASTFLPGNSVIDSIPYIENTGGFFGEGYSAFVYWTDEINETNHYRLKNKFKGVENDFFLPDESILVTEDRLFNGIGTGTPIFSVTYELGDTVIVDLMQIDEHCYTYWYALSQISDPQNQPAAPGNPVSNLSGSALGYFGGYNVSTDTVVIEQ